MGGAAHEAGGSRDAGNPALADLGVLLLLGITGHFH